MSRPVGRQVARIGRLTALSELSKILLRLQILLTEANLSMLASVRRPVWHHHASIVGNSLHASWRWALHRIHGRLASEVLVPWWHACAARRQHLIVLIVLNGSISMHARWLLVVIAVLRTAIYNYTFSVWAACKVTI